MYICMYIYIYIHIHLHVSFLNMLHIVQYLSVILMKFQECIFLSVVDPGMMITDKICIIIIIIFSF